jgi:hypothetical protein
MARPVGLRLSSRGPPVPSDVVPRFGIALPAGVAARSPTDPRRNRREPAPSNHGRLTVAIQLSGSEVRLVGEGMASRGRSFAPQMVIHSGDMKDMTQKQAQAEAVRRWGPTGTIKFRPPNADRRGRLARYCCTVSSCDVRSAYSVEGQGNTWLEAFADASTR